MSSPAPWRGRRVLVTAGPTREALDPVRYLTNSSTGRMGFAVARDLARRGARVTVVAGPAPGAAARVASVSTVPVVTAEEMRRAVLARLPKADAFIAAAAVGDFRFERVLRAKLKKTGRPLRVTLLPTQDILAEVARRWGRLGPSRAARAAGGARAGAAVSPRRAGKLLVGFALETGRWLERAKAKLRGKGLDVVLANGPDALGARGARAAILDRDGRTRLLGRVSKARAARALVDTAEKFL